MSSLDDNQGASSVYCYTIERDDMQIRRSGRTKLAIGTVRAVSQITTAATTLSFGALHFGDHNLTGGVRHFRGKEEYQAMVDGVSDAFARADLVAVTRELDRHFGELSFSLKSLFRADREKVVTRILEGPMAEAETLAQTLYDNHAPLLRYMASLGHPLPKPLRNAVKLVLNLRILRALQGAEPDLDAIRAGFNAAQRLDLRLDSAGLGYAWQQVLEQLSDRMVANPESLAELEQVHRVASLIKELALDVDLWHVQNELYQLAEFVLPRMLKRVAVDEQAKAWTNTFSALCGALKIRCA